jgi:hypothetical protein
MHTWIAALLLPPAIADDVVLSSMQEHGGERVVAPITDDYLALLREIATAVANKPQGTADTLGAYGFELTASNTLAFIHARQPDESPTPWERAVTDEVAPDFLFIPHLQARKGLPMSLEVGMSGGWIGSSNQGTFGGFGRSGLLEGYKPSPDVSVQLGYAGYIGNDELELGVWDIGISLGSTFAFGSVRGVHSGTFSPFLNYTTLRVSAQPLLDEAVEEAIGAIPVSGKKNTEEYEPAMVIPQFSGGFQLENGTFLFRLIATWAPSTIATTTVGVGFRY